MAQSLFVHQSSTPTHRTAHDAVELRTEASFQFVDITALVEERVRRSAVVEGLVTVQSRHTTAAVLVMENEEGLLEDLRHCLEAWAPRNRPWRHDDLSSRKGPVDPGEPRNGHAHAQALLLPCSVTLVVTGGRVDRGRFQSVFLVELDGPRRRTLSVQVSGTTNGGTW
jgi:secondary thiamine-phosphate synthase enzyme